LKKKIYFIDIGYLESLCDHHQSFGQWQVYQVNGVTHPTGNNDPAVGKKPIHPHASEY
jgi:hypothetical protein